MRKRIFRMSEDQFDIIKPQIELSVDAIEMTAIATEPAEGYFVLKSTNLIPVRGVVYSSNPYVICMTPQFEGVDNKIYFRTSDAVFKDGDRLKGEFTIVCNQAEISLPFDIHFNGERLSSSEGEIVSLEEFSHFAESHLNEAMNIFYSDGFARLLTSASPEMRLLYKSYRRALPSEQNFDEFLVAAKLKQRTYFSLEEKTYSFFNLHENLKTTLEITRSNWGYIEISVVSDADFVTVEKEKITSDFFLGSIMNLNFYVHKNRLHAGINQASITFKSGDIEKKITVIASLKSEHDDLYKFKLTAQKQTFDFTNIYIEYRLGRLSTGEWCQQSLNFLENFEERYQSNNIFGTSFQINKKNDMYELMRAHALIANKQRQDALWIISDLKHDIEDKKSREWAYLLYLCTLIEKEENYVNRLTAEIEKIFLERPDDVYIFFFLLFLKKDYINNPGLRLKDIKQWIMSGVNSPYLYVEALYILKQETYLLVEFDEFTVRILNFARKHHALDSDLCSQIGYLLDNGPAFSPLLYQILQEAYKKFPSTELLMGIIAFLIKNKCYGHKYLGWYETAVKQDVKYTGLYEAYIMSLPVDYAVDLPEIVALYFRYDNNLSFEFKSMLYSNIIGHRKEHPAIYEQYLRTIENFAISCLKTGFINDNVAIIYQNLLDLKLINTDIANLMSKVIFHKKIVSMYPDITKVFLYEEHLSQCIEVSLQNNIAYLPILTDHFVISLENEEGRCISTKDSYYLEQMINLNGIYEDVRKNSTDNLNFVIHDMSTRFDEGVFVRDDIFYIEKFINSDALSLEYKAGLYKKLIDFLALHSREDIIDKHMLLSKPYRYLDSQLMTYMINISIDNGFYDEAYRLLTQYNGYGVEAESLLKLCNYEIVYKDFALDDYLILLASMLLDQDKFSEQTIAYLNRYYVGPTRLMVKLWEQTRISRIKSEKLAERTLIQMLYTENIDISSGEIFETYMEHNPNAMVVEAYLTFYAHAYMLESGEVPTIIFPMLEKYYLLEMKLNESCRLALLKYLCQQKDLNEKRFHLLDELLRVYIRRNVYFAFYRKVDQRLLIKYHLYDKCFAEYKGLPGMNVVITYDLGDGQSVSSEMVEMYSGIYVKQFVLFFGQVIKYRLFDKTKPDILLKEDSITCQNMDNMEEEGRFSLLNRMESECIYEDDSNLVSDLKRYNKLNEITKELFTII